MSFDTTHQNTGLSEGQGYALHPKEKRASQPSFLLRITSSTSSSLAFIKALAFSEVASFTSYSPTRECRFALRQPVNHSFFSGSNPQCAYFAKSLAMYGTLKYIRSSSGNGGRGLSIFFFQYLALYCSYLMLYIKGGVAPLQSPLSFHGQEGRPSGWGIHQALPVSQNRSRRQGHGYALPPTGGRPGL